MPMISVTILSYSSLDKPKASSGRNCGAGAWGRAGCSIGAGAAAAAVEEEVVALLQRKTSESFADQKMWPLEDSSGKKPKKDTKFWQNPQIRKQQNQSINQSNTSAVPARLIYQSIDWLSAIKCKERDRSIDCLIVSMYTQKWKIPFLPTAVKYDVQTHTIKNPIQNKDTEKTKNSIRTTKTRQALRQQRSWACWLKPQQIHSPSRSAHPAWPRCFPILFLPRKKTQTKISSEL